jgi:hypothetical protein
MVILKKNVEKNPYVMLYVKYITKCGEASITKHRGSFLPHVLHAESSINKEGDCWGYHSAIGCTCIPT